MSGKREPIEEDMEHMVAGLRNILRRLDESPRRYSLESLLEDVRWMVNDAERRRKRRMNANECKNKHKQYRMEDGCFPDYCPKCCEPCRGFGYTKGGPAGPWEKLDCEECGGSGKKKEKRAQLSQE